VVNAGVERTLLSATFGFDFDLASEFDIAVGLAQSFKPGINCKPVGQECPTHTKQMQKGQSGAPETVPLNPPG